MSADKALVQLAALAGDRTHAIQNAIDGLGPKGGCVVLAAGVHFSCGLTLRSNVELRLAEDAVLKFADSYDAFAATPVRIEAEQSKRAMIVARDATNIAITGPGSIEAQGGAFSIGEDEQVGTLVPAMHRPRVIVFDTCKSVRIEGLRICNSPMWTIHLSGCVDVTVDQVRVENDRRMPNTDGIVVDSCRNVRITKADIRTADDGVVLKTSLFDDGTPIGPSAGIRVSDCYVESNSCALKIGTETHSDITDVVFENCQIADSNRGLGIFSRDGGRIERVRFSDISLSCRETPDGFWGSGEAFTISVLDRRPGEKRAGRVRDVVCQGIEGNMHGALNLYAEHFGDIADVQILHCALTQQKGPLGTANQYDLRPTPADLAVPENMEGRANAWRRGADGRIVGLVPYPDGLPGLFARNVDGLSLRELGIARQDTLPKGFDARTVVTIDCVTV